MNDKEYQELRLTAQEMPQWFYRRVLNSDDAEELELGEKELLDNQK